MSRILAYGGRLLPALLVASAIALLAAGMVAWTDPGVGARGGLAVVEPQATEPLSGDPMGDGVELAGTPEPDVPETPRPTPRPESTRRPTERPTERPTPTPEPTPVTTPEPTAVPTPVPTPEPTPKATPGPSRASTPTPGVEVTLEPTPVQTPGSTPELTPRTPTPTSSPASRPTVVSTPTPVPTAVPAVTPAPTPTAPPVVATRIVIASRHIDLPIISRDRRIKGQGPDKYPPCDVALYHTAFEQPGEAGTTYIYAHAREGMFLPLLKASTRRNGASLIGALVQVYTSDHMEYVYQIIRVKRHALDFSLALDAPRDAHQLILQTSEGPRGTVPKLQVLAEPVDVIRVSNGEANPKPRPRACYNTP